VSVEVNQRSDGAAFKLIRRCVKRTIAPQPIIVAPSSFTSAQFLQARHRYE
jgi:hypothetical protein